RRESGGAAGRPRRGRTLNRLRVSPPAPPGAVMPPRRRQLVDFAGDLPRAVGARQAGVRQLLVGALQLLVGGFLDRLRACLVARGSPVLVPPEQLQGEGGKPRLLGHVNTPGGRRGSDAQVGRGAEL